MKIKIFESLQKAYYSANPYADHLQILIDSNIIPYRNIEDVQAQKVCYFRLARIYALIALLLLNMARFTAISLFRDSSMRKYFAELFANQPNTVFFNVTFVLIFSLPTVLYAMVLGLTCKSTGVISFHVVLDAMLGEMPFPRAYSQSMDHGMRVLTVLHIFLGHTSPIVAIIPVADYYLSHFNGTKEFSCVDLVRFLVWNSILLLAVRHVAAIFTMLIQHSYFINCFFSCFAFIKAQLSNSLNRIGVRRETLTHRVRIRQLQRDLTRVAAKFLRIQRQLSYLAGFLYLLSLAVVEFQLYLLIDARTSPFLRAFVLFSTPVLAAGIFVMFYLMSEFNAKSKQILPQLDKCLHSAGCKSSVDLGKRLFLAEVHQMLGTNRIALIVGGMFYLVRAEVIRASFGVANNLFLIIGLNR